MNDKDQPEKAQPEKSQPEQPQQGKVDVAEDASVATGERSRSLLREIAAGDALAGVLAVFLAIFVGSVMIAATDETVRETASYITARPSDFFTALWDSISGAYSAVKKSEGRAVM